MEQYVIKGGVRLQGEVSIGGAKNAALGILAAAIMTDETVTIENVPNVRDIRVLLQAIEGIGAKVTYVYNNSVQINGGSISDINVDYEYIKKIRASYYLLGALLGKYKESQVALPGGCNIGSRPIDQHIKGCKALGAEVDISYGKIHTKAEKLVGSHIYFDVVTVGATINLMLASCMAEGDTILENAAKEPHIVDVANFLNAMGANIKGAGTDVIRIKGVSLRKKGRKQRHFKNIFFCFGLTAVNVNHISHCLKRIKGNAKRQYQIHTGNGVSTGKQRRNAVYIGNRKIRIF